jgi:hypothetical protein
LAARLREVRASFEGEHVILSTDQSGPAAPGPETDRRGNLKPGFAVHLLDGLLLVGDTGSGLSGCVVQ